MLGFIDPPHASFTNKFHDLHAAEVYAKQRVYSLGSNLGLGSQAKVVPLARKRHGRARACGVVVIRVVVILVLEERHRVATKNNDDLVGIP